MGEKQVRDIKKLMYNQYSKKEKDKDYAKEELSRCVTQVDGVTPKDQSIQMI